MSRRRLLIVLLCVAWILPGLVAHDPWKPDEATNFGVVYEMLRGGSWIVPTLAGEPYLKEPPLAYWSGALTGALLSPPLPLHDAARLASGLYVALALLFCGLAGRELNGPGTGALALVLLLGCFGLVLRGHQLVPHVAGLAGFAMAYYGCARALRSAWPGLWIGTGIGIVFLAQGVPEGLTALMIAALLPLLGSAWRTRQYAIALMLALLAALPWVAIWPALFNAHAPELFRAWLETDVLSGRLRSGGSAFYYLRMLPWYAWPVWPLALWALWRAFGTGPVKPAVTLPLTGLVVTFLGLSEAADKRELYALPLLVPLALLATPGVEALRRGAANAWYWFSVMVFTFFILVGWVYWSGLELGVPPRLHAHLHRMQPGYPPGFRLLPFALAALYSAAWIAVLAKLPKNPQRPAYVWATGMTVTWTLAATLFIGWVDVGKSYRSVVTSLNAALPARYDCVMSRGLGEPQRAMLHYFGDILTQRMESAGARGDCDFLLVQGTRTKTAPPAAEWVQIWEGARPGDKVERYRLYRRASRG